MSGSNSWASLSSSLKTDSACQAVFAGCRHSPTARKITALPPAPAAITSLSTNVAPPLVRRAAHCIPGSPGETAWTISCGVAVLVRDTGDVDPLDFNEFCRPFAASSRVRLNERKTATLRRVMNRDSSGSPRKSPARRAPRKRCRAARGSSRRRCCRGDARVFGTPSGSPRC